MSDVPIDLDSTELFSNDHYTVNVSTEPYEAFKLFMTVTYKVKYKDKIPFPYEMFLFLYKRPFGSVFTLKTGKVVDTVQVFYNISNTEKPLVVGFYAAYEKKYFSYEHLTKAKILPFLTNEFISENGLLKSLVNENNKFNKKLKLVVTRFTNNVNVNETRSKFDNFTQVMYTPQQDQRKDSILYLNFMLNLRVNKDITKDRLDQVHNGCYDAVVVYYSARYVNIRAPLVVELIENGKTYYFSRLTDEIETYWRQFEINNLINQDELVYIIRSTDRLVSIEDKSEHSRFGDGDISGFYEKYPALISDPPTKYGHKGFEKSVEEGETESSGSAHELVVNMKPEGSPNVAVTFFVGTIGLCCGIGAAVLLFRYYNSTEIKMHRFY
ncbi:hypothetical protein MACJ_002622 [Theileria orientalis]|uniref:Uncharacterized protein n=1 Tax=Theileria orientalis TaxID=68886 RepID=A0A976M6H2_THEOR|nr:hypothetical protein MACJ_002622 [Theileria orientalis]